ncbi:telomeric repeat-binding factor 2 [Senna tora]|uniref:Telomeric repeat-binding factor 2 n=1 Tax=Senna tora TaxID=362788 RepID=A0A834WXV3_9FABA|nr:telomeric repeat-binding factor 2 [Senna tora]
MLARPFSVPILAETALKLETFNPTFRLSSFTADYSFFPKAMDADVARWILEFVLRSNLPDSTAKRLFSILPISGVDSRLKKTVLLRSIKSDVSTASLTETLLDTLEIIEEFDRVEGTAITDTMKQAYCAVAVECTIKYLEALPDDDDGDDNHGLYLDAVKRIWRDRIAKMEAATASGEGSELWTAELSQWRDNIEATVWDSKVCEKLVNINSRRIALEKLRAYLAEAWELMGPSFLELAATALFEQSEVKDGSCGLSKDATDRSYEGGDIGVVESDLAPDPLNVGEEARLQNSVAGDGMEFDNAAICSEKVGGNRGSEQLVKKAVISDDGNRESDEIVSPRDIEIVACQNSKLPDKHTVSSTRERGVKIIGDEKVGPKTMSGKYDPLPSIEVEKLRESLKSSSLELKAAVTDPLPEILQKSDIVRSELAMKGISHEPPLENQSRDVDIPESNTCRSIVLYQPIDALVKNFSVNQSNVHCPNLMERNSTAHTHEWDDSIDNLPEGTPRKRRRGKRWTTLEEQTLVAGVNKFGKGNWKTILNFYSEIFKKADRTEIHVLLVALRNFLIAPILTGKCRQCSCRI